MLAKPSPVALQESSIINAQVSGSPKSREPSEHPKPFDDSLIAERGGIHILQAFVNLTKKARGNLRLVSLPLALLSALLTGALVHHVRLRLRQHPTRYTSRIGNQTLVTFTSTATTCLIPYWQTNVGPAGLVVTQLWKTERLK